MRMILRIQLIRPLTPKPLIHPRHRPKMVHIPRSLPDLLRHKTRILHEPRRRVREHPSFPEIIRRLAANDHARARIYVRSRSVEDVFVERVDCRPVFAGCADFVARAGTIAASVVGSGVGRASVVVPEFYYYYVRGLEEGRDGAEASFVRVAARGSAADCFVDYGCAWSEVGGEVGTPAWWGVSFWGLGGGREGESDRLLCRRWRRLGPWCCRLLGRLLHW